MLDSDDTITFDDHVKHSSSRRISALQRPTGFVDMAGKNAIYNSSIGCNCKYGPLLWYFMNRESIVKMQKVRAVLKVLIQNRFVQWHRHDVCSVNVPLYRMITLSGEAPYVQCTCFVLNNAARGCSKIDPISYVLHYPQARDELHPAKFP